MSKRKFVPQLGEAYRNDFSNRNSLVCLNVVRLFQQDFSQYYLASINKQSSTAKPW